MAFGRNSSKRVDSRVGDNIFFTLVFTIESDSDVNDIYWSTVATPVQLDDGLTVSSQFPEPFVLVMTHYFLANFMLASSGVFVNVQITHRVEAQILCRR